MEFPTCQMRQMMHTMDETDGIRCISVIEHVDDDDDGMRQSLTDCLIARAGISFKAGISRHSGEQEMGVRIECAGTLSAMNCGFLFISPGQPFSVKKIPGDFVDFNVSSHFSAGTTHPHSQKLLVELFFISWHSRVLLGQIAGELQRVVAKHLPVAPMDCVAPWHEGAAFETRPM